MLKRLIRLATLLCTTALLAHTACAQQIAIEAPRLVIASKTDAPVTLRAVSVRTEIVGRSALTEVTLRFFNPNPRTLEGELQFPLQDGQAIVGMAMDVNGRLREAVPVDKAQGEAVFEAVTRATIDPALLSHTQGNSYKLRVYPIEPRGEKTVVLRYAEWLASSGGRSHYRLPLAYAARVPELSVQVVVAGAGAPQASMRGVELPAFAAAHDGQRLSFEHRDFAANGVLDIAFAPPAGGSLTTQRLDGRAFFLADLPVAAVTAPRALPRVVSLVWDASGSGAARDHGREFALLGAYVAKARNIDVRLVRIRDAAEATQTFTIANGDWRVLRSALEATVYDGATNLGAFVPEADAGEVLLFSDGLSNFGAQRFPAVTVPVFAISAAVRHDAPRLRAVAEGSGGRFIDLTSDSTAAAASKLLNARTRVVALESNGVGSNTQQLIAASPYDADGSLTLAGELTETRAAVRVTLQHPNGRRETLTVRVDADRDTGTIAARAWARLKVAALDVEYELNRAEIHRLGAAFTIVTRETSLIILDRAQDYARHGITPPPELADEVARLNAQTRRAEQTSASAQLERIVKLFEAKQAWWAREFPKGAMPAPPIADKAARAAGSVMQGEARRERSDDLPAAPPRLSATAPALAAGARDNLLVAAKSIGPSGGTDSAPAATIRLRPVASDAPYAARLRAASDAQLYRVYLDERASYANSTAFILDVADVLYERKQALLATRVLSNLAEMDLENRQVLRILGARLVQAGRADLAVPVFRKVLALAPNEPQSQRDLGLALAASGQPQAAVDALYEVARRQWERFPEVELIALAELNAIVATSTDTQGRPLDTSRIDPRLLKNLPLALRATMSWDGDNTDIDLWVTDPNGERAYYGHPLTYQGGRMSRDITSGYGPEEFSLRHAKPGKYTVTTQFYGHRQQVVSAAMTVQLSLITGFGSAQQKAQTVTLRLKDPKDQVLVGEFEVE